MSVWEWLVAVLCALLVVALVYAIALVVRRRHLSRNGGTFEVGLHRPGKTHGRGWVLGLGRYAGDELQYFRIFSLSLRPKREWSRRRTMFEGQRSADRLEQMSLYPGHVIVRCSTPGGPIELSMTETSLMGFQSWLEARPPGADWNTPLLS